MKKKLSLLDLFSFAAGSMISSGLFILPAIAFTEAGSSCIIGYFLASILILPSVFAKTELATAMPKSGGTYYYVDRILGTQAGIITGMANWISISLKSAFALIGIGASASLIFGDISTFHIKLIAAIAGLFFAITNIVSVKSSGKIQSTLVVFLLIILTGYIILGYPAAKIENFSDFDFMNYQEIFEVTGLVFIAFGGLTKIASIAEESKDTAKNIPKAMFRAFTIVSLLYILVVAVTIGVLSKSELSNTLTPLSIAAEKFMGSPGMIVMSVGAMLAFITTANAGIMAASRVPMAMSKDYHIPDIFGKVSAKFNTPYVSIISTTLIMLTVIFIAEIEVLVKVASSFMILLFIMVNFSLIVVRYSGFRNYRPSFKAPFFPYGQILAIIIYSVLLFEMGILILGLTLLGIILSYFLYALYSKKRDKSASVLINLTQKLLNKQITEDSSIDKLETELMDILRERDEIVTDDFDVIVKKANMIDFNEEISKDQFFNDIAAKIAGKYKYKFKAKNIYDKLTERETISNTNIVPNVAIPHIILDGKNEFYMWIIRNKKGFDWGENSKVKLVFLLMGTMDKRNLHLKSLMAIAHLIQDEKITKYLEEHNDLERIRSSILLTKRIRTPQKEIEE